MPETWEDEKGLNKNDPEDRNGIGEGGFTNLEVYLNSITNFGPYLMAPVNFKADLQNFINVKLTWEDLSDEETGFRIERAETETGSFTIIAELNANTTTYLDTTLKELTTYRYRLMVFNDSLKSGYSAIKSVFTLSPTAKPTAVNTPSPETDAMYLEKTPTLMWEASLNANNYDVYFGTQNPPAFVRNQTGTTFNPGELENGIKYYWRIDGKNLNGTTEGQIWNFTVKPFVPEELIAHWKLNETEGIIASDEGKYGMHGNLMNMDTPLWTKGISGGGLHFDGKDDYVAIPHNGVLDFANESFSISLYAKIESLPSGSVYLIHKGTFAAEEVPGSNGAWFGLEIKNGELRFAVDDNIVKSQTQIGGIQDKLLNKWVHIVAIRDKAAGLIKLYVNEELLASAPDGTGSISQNMDLHFGNNSKIDGALTGVIDEVKLFSYALSDTELIEKFKDIENANPTFSNELLTSRNFPNPFNSSTTIKYELKNQARVELTIYNSIGEKIATLVNQKQPAGYHSAIFNANTLKSGIYTYSIKIDSAEQKGKMLLIK